MNIVYRHTKESSHWYIKETGPPFWALRRRTSPISMLVGPIMYYSRYAVVLCCYYYSHKSVKICLIQLGTRQNKPFFFSCSGHRSSSDWGGNRRRCLLSGGTDLWLISLKPLFTLAVSFSSSSSFIDPLPLRFSLSIYLCLQSFPLNFSIIL